MKSAGLADQRPHTQERKNKVEETVRGDDAGRAMKEKYEERATLRMAEGLERANLEKKETEENMDMENMVKPDEPMVFRNRKRKGDEEETGATTYQKQGIEEQLEQSAGTTTSSSSSTHVCRNLKRSMARMRARCQTRRW